MKDRGAFFGSIFGTLSHVVLADILWLKRFASHSIGFDSLDCVQALPLAEKLNSSPWTSIYPIFSTWSRCRDN